MMRWTRIFACMAGALALATVIIQPTDAASQPYSSITNAVQAYVQKDAAARHFDLISVTFAGPQVQQIGTTVTLSYAVTTTHTLDVTSVDDWPTVKGIENFLANNSGLSAAARSAVQQLLGSWKTRIQGYMDNPFTSNGGIEATASLDSAGNVIPGTIRVFFENPDGSLVPEAEALADIPSTSSVERRFGLLAASTAQQSSVSPDCLPGGGCPYNYYSATNAVSYADNHVSHSCGPVTRTASCGTNNTYGCIEWPYASPYGYNLSYWFSTTCDDCANFVSQSLAAGGIPEVTGTSGWYEDTNGQKGSDAWTYVPSLQSYMTSHSDTGGIDYWSQVSTQSDTVPGDVLWHYVGSGTGHVMTEVYNDGTNIYWDEHTNDGYHLPVLNYQATYYHVSDWRI